MRVAFYTLGCKVNQFESTAMEEQFEAEGCQIVSWKEHADIYVVNTCAVTSKAAYQSRQILSRLKREHPDSKIIATGCHVQTDPSMIIESVGKGVCLAGNEQKPLIASMSIKHTGCTGIFITDISKVREIAPLCISRPPRGRTRAFVKIQDGCDAYCSYCIVPYARGRSRSLPQDLVFKQVQNLTKKGVREVVLTGIHIGMYGKDLPQQGGLLDLLKGLCSGFKDVRFRLSSIEAKELSQGFIEWAASTGNFCKHFHIPLQSGSGKVLRDMNRNYTPDEFVDLLQRIRELIPLCAIGTDVMTGFPTEGEHEFQETVSLLKVAPISYLHAFPYSPRPGTMAVSFPCRATRLDAKKRAKMLIGLGQEKCTEFCRGLVGTRLEVLIEGPAKMDGYLRGKSDNYVEVLVPASQAASGSMVKARIIEVQGDSVIGEVAQPCPKSLATVSLRTFME